MITTILIDDDKEALELLEINLRKYCPSILILEKFTNPKEAIKKVRKLKPTCIFLDIEMPELSGLDFVNFFNEGDFQVIFTTGHIQYSYDAIKRAAIDFLLKPINKEELILAVKKIIPLTSTADKSKIGLNVNGSVEFYKQEDIIMVKSEGNYSKLYLEDDSNILLCKTLKEVQEKLDSNLFFRIHKSFLINLNHVKKYTKSYGGEILMSNGKYSKISETKKTFFTQMMNQL